MLGLTVDFPGIRQGTQLADLASRDRELELFPVVVGALPHEFDAASYAGRLAERLPPGRRAAALVVGYCMSAPIAYHLARVLGQETGTEPVAVMLDGVPHLGDAVAGTYRELLVRYGADRTQPEVSGAELRQRPQTVLAGMAGTLREAAARRIGAEVGEEIVVADIVEDLVGHATAWLTHLIAGHNADFPPWRGTVVMVNSRDAEHTDPWPRAGHTRTVPVDCAHDELIDHPDVVRILAAAPRIATGAAAAASNGHHGSNG